MKGHRQFFIMIKKTDKYNNHVKKLLNNSTIFFTYLVFDIFFYINQTQNTSRKAFKIAMASSHFLSKDFQHILIWICFKFKSGILMD